MVCFMVNGIIVSCLIFRDKLHGGTHCGEAGGKQSSLSSEHGSEASSLPLEVRVSYIERIIASCEVLFKSLNYCLMCSTIQR